MTPFYGPTDGISIFHGDCAEIAPTLGRFDLLCTDPPYGIGEARKDHGRSITDRRAGRSGIKVMHNYGKKYDKSDWDDGPASQDLIDDLIGRSEWCCLFGGNYYTMLASKCWLVWDKENGASDFADAELAWTNYTRAVRLKRYQWNGMLRGGVSGRSAEPRYHPTQKPLAVMSWAISLCPERPTSILDPFMGSGTTLVAAKQLGIRAVGIDREEKYCEIAADRLRQGVLGL